VSVKAEVAGYRKKIAEILGVSEKSVIFTSGGTEANVLAVRGVKQGKVIIQPGSHPSVEESVLENAFRDVTLVSSPVIDSELGRQIRKEREKNNSDYPLLHVDASGGAQYFDIGLEKLACDLITLDASKLYGPKGVGALIVRRGVSLNLHPLGTPAVPLIAGFAKALEIAERDRESEFKRLEYLSGEFIKGLEKDVLTAEVSRILPNIVNVSVPGILPEMLVLALDRAGVAVSAGPACNFNKPEPPFDATQGKPETPVRFSFGRDTTKKDIDKVLEIFPKLIRYDKP
jgi:cysteine desulfurase